MQIREIMDEKEQIKEISYSLQEDACVIRWKWPQNLDSIWIVKTKEKELPIHIDQGKLYTKEEYKAQNGYREKVEEIGKFIYTVYPCYHNHGEIIVGNQENKGNQITVITGKIHIYYSLKEKAKWFSNKKSIQIQIHADQGIPKEMICYVKKKGAYPVEKNDGIVFPFVQDLHIGVNVFPEIEFEKDEYVKLFLTDGKQFGDIYHLFRR